MRKYVIVKVGMFIMCGDRVQWIACGASAHYKGDVLEALLRRFAEL